MSYIHVTRSPGMALADYESVRAAMGEEPVPGQLSHYVGESNGSLCIVDVWSTKADADRFAGERLFPAFERVGVQPGSDAVMLAFEGTSRA
jgi:hypothetical protein